MVSRASPASNSRSITCATARTLFHSASVSGFATLRGSSTRSRAKRKLLSVSTGATVPATGAASAGTGTHASGMCPSAAICPEVESSPTQPAPGRKTSVQACNSTWSSVGAFGSSILRISGASCTR